MQLACSLHSISLKHTNVSITLSTHTVCSADLDPHPFDCQEAYVLGCRRSGVYTIDPGCGKPFSVWCDMNNGGGWTVFQRRRDGSENFYRGWTDYENGFGNVKGEHWLGLKKISCLTSVKGKTKLRIDLDDFEGYSKFACYDSFHVGNPSTNYKLTIGGYQNWGIGAAGDSMTRSGTSNNGMQFTTYDRDNDGHSSINCATSSYRRGAWWYNTCGYSNLNGLYRDGRSDSRGVTWRYFNATALSWRTLRYSDMKLRRSGWRIATWSPWLPMITLYRSKQL